GAEVGGGGWGVVGNHASLRSSGRKERFSRRLRVSGALFRFIPGPRCPLLHGHTHRRYYHPPTEKRPHVFCAGSSTQKGREGYWLIRVENGQIAGGVQQVPARVND